MTDNNLILLIFSSIITLVFIGLIIFVIHSFPLTIFSICFLLITVAVFREIKDSYDFE